MALLVAALAGAFHGINPAMGWLFAVFLALHRKDRSVLFRAVLPIALGHMAAVGAVVAVVAVAQSALPVDPVRYAAAGAALAFGLYRLFRYYRHFTWSTLNVTYRDLALWSCLAATSHGSGVMLTPLVLGLPGGMEALALVAVHTAAMLAVMTAVAVLVHDRLQLAVLRRFWVNFDLLWAIALVIAGGLSVVAAVSHRHA